MTVKNGSTADAAYIVQKTYSRADEQLWYIEKTRDSNPDTYQIISKKSQKVGDIKGASTPNGAYLAQYHTKGGNTAAKDNQRFKLVDVGNGYFNIIAKHSGKVFNGKQDAWGDYATNAAQIKARIDDIVSRINPATNQPYGLQFQ